ncbi:uncharacterized protein Dana_GF15298 [Drosophila ananassae]|uniref:SAM domain-containing protein n=1 Tax=Drosophila ananassae TaxID=7217 RepID=B3MJB1_DROAN|nr:uncharacterized protein LOC6498111 [Drosophila ananassae]EDV31321.1 uncharacterized protein Dana_GF15298 [Drosophila ananassae]
MTSKDASDLAPANMSSAVQFDLNKDFHTRTHQQELDKSFIGYERRPWVKPNLRRDPRRDREILNALMAQSAETGHVTNCVDKLIDENISCRDLASLSNEDLELFGFKYSKQRQELLEMFAKMPNQDPSYEHLCNEPIASTYNNKIIENAGGHFMSMRASLAATNYKLQVMPPDDVVVGDKSYASSFALDTLKSVKKITDEIAKDLRQIEDNARIHWKKQDAEAESTKKKKFSIATIMYYTALAVGFSCTWFWWWTKFHSAPRLERISIQT